MTTNHQRGHLRFVGGVVYCPRAERRISLGDDHLYGQEFICPGCGVRVDARPDLLRPEGRR